MAQIKRRIKSPGKNKARQKLNIALKQGKIEKSLYEMYGKRKVEAHHIDYRKPLQVKWLCRRHHMLIEGKKS